MRRREKVSAHTPGWAISVLLWALLMTAGCQREEMHMDRLVPWEMEGWKASDEGRRYDRETIFDYIDGSGELYLRYAFRQVLVRRFAKPGEPDIEVSLFDMGSSEDAFGIFSFEQEGDDLGIGQGSEYAAGLLRFWKGRFFVCVLTERETPAARGAVAALAREIAHRIQPAGAKPQIVNLLPRQGLLANSIRYFHEHSCLNYHYFVSDQNILDLSERTQAVIAQYQMAEGKSHLLLVAYQDAEQAKAAFDSFIASYLPEGGRSGIAQTEDGRWTKAGVREELVMVVFDSPSREEAEALIEAVERRARGGRP